MTTHDQPHPHDHAATLDAPVAFINTLELDAVPQDHLQTADDAVAFFDGRGLAHGDDLRAHAARLGEPAWLDRVRAARAALREVWDARVDGRPPADDALEAVNALLDRGPRVRLVAAPDGVAVVHRHDDDPTAEALARTAAPIVEAIAAGDTDRWRICANDGCRWVFADESRAGRRRWCDMTSCGNRAKAARFRARRRSGGGDGAAGDPETGAPVG